MEGEAPQGLADRFRDHHDQAAFQTLLAQCRPPIWRYICQMAPGDADDVFQNACLTLAQSLTRKTPENVLAHFMLIARKGSGGPNPSRSLRFGKE